MNTTIHQADSSRPASAGPNPDSLPKKPVEGISILLAEPMDAQGADFLRAQPGVTVTELGKAGPTMPTEVLVEALCAHDGCVVRSGVKLREPILEAVSKRGGKLRAIARAGVGVDNIDVPAATRLGMAVMNSASASTITTAEHAFAMMISLARNISQASATMRSGGWDRGKFIGSQLHGRTLGVVGFGRIGQTMARRALAFGMHVIAFDPMINASKAMDDQVELLGSFDDLLPHCDFLSFHVPGSESTLGMLGREQFARAKKGVMVINAARGGVVDEAALLEAVENGQCGGAAIDVYAKEPPPEDMPLRTHPKIVCTPHLGASTVEAQEAVAVDACKALHTFLRGEGLVGAVNAGGLSMDLTDRQKAFVDLAGRMVALLDAATGPLKIQGVRVQARGESLAGRAETIARFALAEVLRRRLASPVNVINAPLVAEQRHIDVQTTTLQESGQDRLAIEIVSDEGTRRVEGAIYADNMPRITNLDGYAMDMVPDGPMVLLTNADVPGRIGVVGQLFGASNANIADMVIGRPREKSVAGEVVAMMIIRLDTPPDEKVIEQLRATDGILRVASVTLPGV